MNIYFEDDENDEEVTAPSPWWIEAVIVAAVFALIGALSVWYGRT